MRRGVRGVGGGGGEVELEEGLVEELRGAGAKVCENSSRIINPIHVAILSTGPTKI